jgi:hypothetical protein
MSGRGGKDMNQSKKGLPQAQVHNQLRGRQLVNPHLHQPGIAQARMTVASQMKKLPVAAPVYRPQPAPKALQPKMAQANGKPPQPVAPPVCRPQPVPKVLQTKSVKATEAAPRAGRQPAGYSGHKPVSAPQVVQRWAKTVDHNRASGVIQPDTLGAALYSVAGVLSGGAIGSFVPLVGTALGAAIGGAIGGAYGYLLPNNTVQTPPHIAPAIAPTVIGRTAADAIIQWLNGNGYGGATNYTAGVLNNDDLMISKVGGVTARTGAIAQLGIEIQARGYHTGRRIYLAQKFTNDSASNHAEMCILAAAAARGQTVQYMKCTGDHCPYCAETMSANRVTLGNPISPKSQQGWAHPFHRLFYGTQTSGTQQAKLLELRAVHNGNITAANAPLTGTVNSDPQGNSTLWF